MAKESLTLFTMRQNNGTLEVNLSNSGLVMGDAGKIIMAVIAANKKDHDIRVTIDG